MDEKRKAIEYANSDEPGPTFWGWTVGVLKSVREMAKVFKKAVIS